MSATEPITDAEVVVVPDQPEEPAQPRVGVALAPRTRTREVIRPLDVAEQKAAMQTYQQGLHEILDGSDWQDAGRGERFVKKSGWRKIAAWFDLDIELLRDDVDRDEEGHPLRATVWARAVAPSGRHADADGHCSSDEKRFADARGRQKLENDLRGTATTRAVNRAISNLVGMGAVSAEEVDAPSAQPQPAPGPPFGPPLQKENAGKYVEALKTLTTLDGDALKALSERIKQHAGGYLPDLLAGVLTEVALSREPVPFEETPPVPEPEPPEAK